MRFLVTTGVVSPTQRKFFPRSRRTPMEKCRLAVLLVSWEWRKLPTGRFFRSVNTLKTFLFFRETRNTRGSELWRASLFSDSSSIFILFFSLLNNNDHWPIILRDFNKCLSFCYVNILIIYLLNERKKNNKIHIVISSVYD